jgi:glycosyltransferase involved in cell wall biosynthesis
MSEHPPRRILFFEGAEDGTTGGSHQSMYDVVRHLDRKRFEPLVAFSQNNRYAQALRERGVTVCVLEAERERERRSNESGSLPRKSWSALGAVLRRARLLRDRAVDLLHLNNSPLLGIDDWVPAALCLGIPCMANSMGRPYGLPLGLRRRVARRLRCVRAISQHVARELRSGGWDERRIRTVPLSVDRSDFEARVTRSARDVRAALGLRDGRVLIAMVGNIREWKGQHLVVEALAQLPAELLDRLALIFVGATAEGDREYHAALEAAVRRHGLEHHVAFLGSRTDVADLIGASDVVVHASTTPEPFGLVVVEGMILGKAVIAAGSGGPSEIVTAGSGLLFESGNARDLAAKLHSAVADAELRAALGSAARQRARHFSIEREVDALQAIYAEILEGSAAARAT